MQYMQLQLSEGVIDSMLEEDLVEARAKIQLLEKQMKALLTLLTREGIIVREELEEECKKNDENN